MKKCLLVFVGIFAVCAAYGADRGDSARAAIASRATVGVANIGNKSSLKWQGEPVVSAPSVVTAQVEPVRNNRDAERTACISNNIGIGNTFVWASRYSNVNDYSSMVEDVNNPENNVCFVRVELRSNDSRIDMSGLGGKYFEMGQNITCGSWVDESLVEKRILDAKKTGRTLATVGGAVGGAAVGVGAMELFGNKLIGGAVQGQKALSDDELFVAQLKELKNSDTGRYDSVVSMLKSLQDACNKNPQDDCKKVTYDKILKDLDELTDSSEK